MSGSAGDTARKVLIAGGGIAGMAAALAFLRAGWAAELFERAEVLEEVGAGIQLSPNACRVLDWLGVLEEVQGRAFSPAAAEMRNGLTGTIIYRAPLGAEAMRRWGAPYLHVHRADLLDVLMRAAEGAGVRVLPGSSALRAEDDLTGASLFLDDGTARKGDLVIGADGIRSTQRSGINEEGAPRFSGQVAWRGLVPASVLPGGLVAPNATVWAGPGQHLVSYFVCGGELVNFVAVQERQRWAEEGWSLPGDPGELRAAFEGWHPSVTGLLDRVQQCFLWGLFDRPEQANWTGERRVLIGDAAHPMLPFMAQGAAQALEDVAALLRHLASEPDVPVALGAWETERRPRVAWVMRQARSNGRLFHKRTSLGRAFAHGPVAMVSRMAPGLAAGQLDRLYGFDPVAGR